MSYSSRTLDSVGSMSRLRLLASVIALTSLGCSSDTATPTAASPEAQVVAESRVEETDAGAASETPRSEKRAATKTAPDTPTEQRTPASVTTARVNAAIQALVRSRALRLPSPAELGEMERTLNRIAKLSPKGERAVAVRRQVLDALKAAGADAIDGATPSENLAANATDVLELEDGAGGITEQVAMREAPEGQTTCTTWWEGVEYTGECATQQEMDDAIALIEGMGNEVQQDFDYAHSRCQMIYGTGEYCYAEQDENSDASSTAATLHLAAFELEDGASDFSSSSPAAQPCSAAVSVPGQYDTASCFKAGLDAALALVAYGFSKSEALSVMRAASRNGVAAAVFGAFSAGYLAGSAVMAYLDCVNAQ